MNKKIAVFPGSFSPYTLGHKYIIDKALPLFDKIIIAVGTNSEKKYFFSEEQRLKWIKDLYQNEPKIENTNEKIFLLNLMPKILHIE